MWNNFKKLRIDFKWHGEETSISQILLLLLLLPFFSGVSTGQCEDQTFKYTLMLWTFSNEFEDRGCLWVIPVFVCNIDTVIQLRMKHIKTEFKTEFMPP